MAQDPPRISAPVTASELNASFSPPAPLVNKFIVHTSVTGVRIAFAEEVPGGGTRYFRAAVNLSMADAVQLYQILQEIMQPIVGGPSRKATGPTDGD